MNKVIRRSYRKKIGILKINGMPNKKQRIYVFTWAAMGLPAHATLSQPVILPTAEDMNLFIKVTVTLSKGRGKPPNSNIIFCCLSKLLTKWDIWVPSDGLQAISVWLRLDQRDSKLSLKLERSERKWLTSSTLFLQKRQSSPSVFVSQGTPPFNPKFPMSLICTWRRLTRSG